MSVKVQESSRVHRFRDLIAIDFPDTKTLYLTTKHAKKLRRVLADYIDDIAMCNYDDPHLSITDTRDQTWPEPHKIVMMGDLVERLKAQEIAIEVLKANNELNQSMIADIVAEKSK